MLLCPYGYGVNYINHNQTKVNVRLQWAEDGKMGHQSKWIQQSPAAMEGKASPGLFVDYVATRDIERGEELFLDYGDEWEKAWQAHVAKFTDLPDGAAVEDNDYMSAREYNIKYATSSVRTEREQERAPYPSNLEIRCLFEINDPGHLSSEAAKALWTIDNDGTPCRILERRRNDDGEVLHRVEFEAWYRDEENPENEEGVYEWTESDWIVREAISFVDAPYSTDMHLPEAFRHSIGIPDTLFPDAWKGYDYRKKEARR